MSTAAVYPGSFDPVHNGHVDVIQRVAGQLDRVVVACLRNISKQPLFEADERMDLLRAATDGLDNVEITSFDGLLVDFCAAQGIPMVVKGLRTAADLQSEFPMAQMNRSIGEVETLFIATSPIYSFLSSSLVKEVARFGGDISEFVPELTAQRLRERIR